MSRTVGLMNPQPARLSDHHTRRSSDGRLRGGTAGPPWGAAVMVTISAPAMAESLSLAGGECSVCLLRGGGEGVLG